MVQVDGFFLLRGLGRSGEHWKFFTEKLRTSFPQKKIIVGDLPGAGNMKDVSCPLSVSKMADLVWVEYGDQLPQKTALIGMSLGGMVSIELAKKFPGQIESLFLINSTASSSSRPWERLTVGALTGLLKAVSSRNPEQREAAILKLVSQDRERANAILKDWVQVAQRDPIAFEQILRQLVAGSWFRSPGRLGVRGLHLVGARDRLIHPKAAQRLSKELGLTTKIHPSAGHDITVDDADWVIQTMREFLA